MTLVDLLHQVQKVLGVRNGGTGNTKGWATDAVVGAYNNLSGVTLARGTLVQLANSVTMGGGRISDSRIKKTTTARQQDVLGVVVGRFRTDDPVNAFEDADALDGDVAAVVIMGKALTTVEGTATLAEYAYSAATDGAASSSVYLEQAGFGVWESTGSGKQWLRLFGTTTTPGVVGSILAVLGDGVTTPTPNTAVDVVVPFDLRLTDWTMVSTYSGSISVDLYADSYANFPPQPADSITASEPPFITSGIKNQADVPYSEDQLGNPHGWDRDLDAGTVLRFNVESAAGLKQVSLLLKYVRR